jgi:hypothetical protein
MSYDIELLDPVTREVLHMDSPHQMTGGTYARNGTTEMWLNITYNYAPFYKRPDVFGENGIRTIYGMTGAESIPVLNGAINALGDNTSKNYWDATEGNAKRPLYQLLAFAKTRPDGVWDGD